MWNQKLLLGKRAVLSAALAAFAVALTAVEARAGDPPRLKAGFDAKLKAKIQIGTDLTFPCPTVDPSVKISVGGNWTPKEFSKQNVAAAELHREAGVSRDTMWCSYQMSAANVPGSNTSFQLVREPPPGTPICEPDSSTKSFTCYALKPGARY